MKKKQKMIVITKNKHNGNIFDYIREGAAKRGISESLFVLKVLEGRIKAGDRLEQIINDLYAAEMDDR